MQRTILVTLVAGGCLLPPLDLPKSSTTDVPDTTDPDTTDATTPAECVEAELGSSGGVVEGAGIRVEFPTDALTARQTVTVCPASVPADVMLLGGAWEITSDAGDLQLAAPATVILERLGEGDPALFVPGADGAPVRALQAAVPFEGAVEGPLYRGGLVFAAVDERLLEPYTGGSGLLDVLFVVDDSCSMADNQARLADEFALALPALFGRDLDLHAGVVTTDMDSPSRSGELVEVAGLRWVDPGTPDAAAVFSRMAQPGTSGSGTEKGIGAIHAALHLHADTVNAGFQREGASLAVVVVSDENDYTPNTDISMAEFVDWFVAARTAPASTVLHAIVNPPGGGPVNPVGGRYLQVADQTGGAMVDINAPDWSEVFDRLASDMGASAGMVLSAPTERGAIEVWWVPADQEPELLDFAFEPAENRVVVDPAGHPSDEIVILYAAL